jgi:predicted CXXCH cytochrome family protein
MMLAADRGGPFIKYPQSKRKEVRTVRRLTLLLAGAALWLFLAAIPALADGGPHVSTVNSGSGGLTADSCAGCHRAHTAQGLFLLKQEEGPALCLTCHGSTGVGATTDVETGQQYTPDGTTGTNRGVALGALRAGGFVQARIASGDAVRVAYLSGGNVRQLAKVPVGPAQDVTSAHLPLVDGEVVKGTGIAWGNGPDSTTGSYAGPSVNMDCTSCHNPHGNGQYRILNKLPEPAAASIDVFVPAAADALVTDAALPPAGGARNYTIIQTNGGAGTLLAAQVDALNLPATAGDYFRRKVPWNATSGSSNDAPNGISATFTTEISTWCLTCHSRYLSAGWAVQTPDVIYKYRHTATNTSRNCITCHVAHGSNAQMSGAYSSDFPYPGGAAPSSASSRLLKINNRGTCQACHDPTGTITAGTQVGPTPNPVLP